MTSPVYVVDAQTASKVPTSTFTDGNSNIGANAQIVVGSTPAPVTASNPFFVQAANNGTFPTQLTNAIPAGTNAIGTVGVTALPALPIGTNSIGLVTGQGAVTTAAPTYTTGTTQSLSLTLAGALRVDASATTQPVSGTVTLGAGTSLVGTVLNEAAVTTAAPAYTTGTNANLSLNTAGGLRVDGSGVTQPVSGTITLGGGTSTIGYVNAVPSSAIVQTVAGLSWQGGIASATVIKTGTGRLVRVSVMVAGSTAGNCADASTTAGATAGYQFFVIPNTVGVYYLDWPITTGLVVTPGTGQTVAVSYT